MRLNIFILLIVLFAVSCSEQQEPLKPSVPKTTDIVKPPQKPVERIEEFKSERLKFRLATQDDVDETISMHKENAQDNIFFFGGVLSDAQLRRYIARLLQDNVDYLTSRDVINLTWSIFAAEDAKKSAIKAGDFLGNIQAQKLGQGAFGLPAHFADMLDKKRPINVAIFLKTSARAQGFGTEAIKAFVNHVFKFTDALIIVHISDEGNVASRRAALSAGFTQIGEFSYQNRKSFFLIKEKEDGGPPLEKNP